MMVLCFLVFSLFQFHKSVRWQNGLSWLCLAQIEFMSVHYANVVPSLWLLYKARNVNLFEWSINMIFGANKIEVTLVIIVIGITQREDFQR